MNRIRIPNGALAIKAEYKDQAIHDYRGNPFIEALPQLLSPDEVIERISLYPNYNKNERKLDAHYRIHMIDRLFKVFQPLPMHINLETKISRAIRQGYLSRNCFSMELVQGLQEHPNNNSNFMLDICSNFNSSSFGFSFIGISGLGKTSSLQRILNLYPQIIVHSEYKGISFSNYQIVWIKIECPHDGSIKGLAYEFFAEIDRLLGTNYYEKLIRVRATTDAAITMMGKVVRNCSIGLIVIDEIQHLNMAKSGGKEKMLNFFVNLINNVGIPMILVGTPKAIDILQGDFRQARRGIGSGGDMICNRLSNDKTWELLVKTIWNYQWTKKETKLNKELIDVLYDQTQGIPDLLKKVYGIAQAYVISEGKEELTSNIIKKVSKENLKLVQPMINALRTNNLRELAKYEDISVSNVNFNDFLTHTEESIDLDMRVRTIRKKQKEEKDYNVSLKKKELILRLVDLGYNPKKVQKLIENSKYEFGRTNINRLIINSIKTLEKDNTSDRNMEGKDKSNKKLKKDLLYESSCLYKIVDEGKKSKKNAYESLLDSGYIRKIEEDLIFRR